MVKIAKPTSTFKAHLHLKYRGMNIPFLHQTSFVKVVILDIDYSIKEELVVAVTLLDGTEVKFSMASNNLYMKVEGKYLLFEGQFYCNFDLKQTDEMFFFDGYLSYENNLNPSFVFKEDYIASIVLNRNERLLAIWNKHR